ncbi:outer dense fiber protein 3-B-like [Gouania willdenowi]|uniref:Outer dense fiber protein 3-B-like n=1 Tax=Gouania willdenowi TaxID=441366 RepID=A0A8C5D1Q8_GOUWI|nr:outer dense fiber protein 3-B-like [Gouania willdenowi]
MNCEEAYVGTWRPHKPKGPIGAHYKGPGPKYLLPSLTGNLKHDVTKHRAPMYSIGKRPKELDWSHSPGPKYALPSNIGMAGQGCAPAFSLKSRPKDQESLNVPGPGHYDVQKGKAILYPKPPSFSLYGRGKEGCDNLVPGPATYNLPPLLGPNIVSKPSAPAVSLRSRDIKGSVYGNINKTPGPATYGASDTNICGYKAPRFSMCGRNYPPKGGTKTPAPTAHYPEHVTIATEKAPSYTFGLRHSEYITPFRENVTGTEE